MIDVQVDTSQVAAMFADLEKQMADVDKNVLKVAKFGAERLRRTDPYQNRTGELRANTRAMGTGNVTVLEMGMFYASFVNKLGFSNFDEVADWVAQQVDQGIDRALESA